jgi:ribosome maturation factor RimP
MSTVVTEIENLINKQDWGGYFLVGLNVSGRSDQMKIKAYFDGILPLSIHQCSEIAYKLNKLLSETLLTNLDYTLEVSSPGADKPLVNSKQYYKHVGRELEVTKHDSNKIKGVLKGVNEHSIILELEKIITRKEKKKELIEIPFSEIKNSMVMISFN